MKLHPLAAATLLAAALGAPPLLTPVATAADGAADPGPSAAAAQPTGAVSCAEVGIVTVDGSGRGWGDLSAAGEVLGRAGLVIERAVVEAGGSTVQRHLGTDFPAAASLVPRPSSGRPVAEVVTPERARAWREGSGEARRSVQRELVAMVERCPEQVLVLVGKSQGAGVVHKVVGAAEDDEALAGRLAGAVLVSDPNRVSRTAARVYGDPAAARSTAGVLTALVRVVPDVPTATQDLTVATVCAAGDLVCDLGRTPVDRALAAHASYAGASGRAAVRDAASALAERTSAWPRVGDQPLTAPAGVGFALRLPLRVGERFADGVAVEPVGALPAGLALSRSGVLSGTVATAGSLELAVRVRGTAPRTSWATGSVTLEVTTPPATTSLAAGGQSTCWVTPAGGARCAGANTLGQLGDGTTRDRVNAVVVGQGAEDWASVDTSGNVTCGVKESGALYCWGANNRGQLGLGGGSQQWVPRQVGDATDWAQVSVGWMHACGVRTGGALYCWGEGERGQLGDGSRTSTSSPRRVGSGSSWASVTAGGWHSCGVRENGSAACWGLNDFGQLGIGTTGWRMDPTEVASARSWVELDATWSSTCGLDTAGRVLCWGLNDQGQLGDGTRTTRFDPTGTAGDRAYTDVTVGDAHACGLDRRGGAWCWGRNSYGQLGDGSGSRSTSPVAVAGGRTYATVDAGWMHTCALTPSGQVQCWGGNERGQLDRGDREDRPTPPGVAVPRPRVVLAREGSTVVATTFNALGSQHTRPGGGAGNYAPGRIRSEWTADLVRDLRSSFVGFQELQTDQYDHLRRALDERYDFYPRSTANPRVVWQTVIWDQAQWEYVDSRIVDIPFLGKTRPNPMVRLRNTSTGSEVWVLNVHNVSKQIPSRQEERDEAVRIELRHILAEREQGVPVVFLGDMNEREVVFCKVTGQTDLSSVTGGSHSGGTCSPPRRMRIDWIFASPELQVVDADYLGTPQVRRITDHHLLTARLAMR